MKEVATTTWLIQSRNFSLQEANYRIIASYIVKDLLIYIYVPKTNRMVQSNFLAILFLKPFCLCNGNALKRDYVVNVVNIAHF